MKKSRLLLKQLLIFISLILLSHISPANAILPSFIKGTVYNTFNNSVIRGATISTSTGISITTASGNFSFRVPPNEYTILISANNFNANLLAGIITTPGQTANLTIGLSPSSTETGYVEGHIYEKNSGSGIQGALVIANLGGAVFSDSTGYYKLSSPAGPATVMVSAEGFTTKIIENIKISPKKTTISNIYLVSATANNAFVEGSVQDICTGIGIKNSVILSNAGSFLITNDGFFSTTIPSGLSTVVVSANGYQFAAKTLTISPYTKMIENIQLIPSSNGTGVVRGTVSDSITDENLAGVAITADTGQLTFSAEDGSYQLYISTCTTSITASREGFVSQRLRVSVSRGSTTIRNFSLNPLGSISGTITDSTDNHTVSGALIKLNEDENLLTISGDNGFYLLENILPGTYSLKVSHQCYMPEVEKDIEVFFGETTEENFSLLPFGTGTLMGTVSNKITGESVRSAVIAANHGSQTLSGQDGYYEITLPECQTNITVKAKGYITKTIRDIFIEAGETLQLDIDLIPCPVALSLISPGESINVYVSLMDRLRNYRDEFFLSNNILRKYTDFFYLYAEEIAAILYQNPQLKKDSRRVLLQANKIITSTPLPSSKTVSNFCRSIVPVIRQFRLKTNNKSFQDLLDDFEKALKDGTVLKALIKAEGVTLKNYSLCTRQSN